MGHRFVNFQNMTNSRSCNV